MIRTTDRKKEREELFFNLYKTVFPLVARFVGKQGGSLENAKDIFQEGLLVYYEKKTLGSEVDIKNYKAYVYSTCRNLWFQKFNQDKMEEKIELAGDPEGEPETTAISKSKILQLLETAGRKCMQILHSFYYEKLSLEEIAEEQGFSNVRSATVQKYKCLEKIRDTVQQKKYSYETFTE